MDKEHYSILIFGPKTSRTRHLKIRKKTFKIALYLFAFALLSTTFFFCDYIQVKKKAFELCPFAPGDPGPKVPDPLFLGKNRRPGKTALQLKDFDKKIRIIANLERGQETNCPHGNGRALAVRYSG